MAKKKKSQAQPEKKSKNLIMIIAVIAVIAAVAIAAQMRSPSGGPSGSEAVSEQSLRKGETRPTLSPSQFSDPFVAAMYQAAKDIPHVFDSVKCYCYCERDPFRHKSLLSCFVDTHAAG